MLSNHKKEKFEQPAEWPDREAPATSCRMPLE